MMEKQKVWDIVGRGYTGDKIGKVEAGQVGMGAQWEMVKTPGQGHWGRERTDGRELEG